MLESYQRIVDGDLVEECRRYFEDAPGPHVDDVPDHYAVCWQIVDKCAALPNPRETAEQGEQPKDFFNAVQMQWIVETCVMEQVPLAKLAENQVLPAEGAIEEEHDFTDEEAPPIVSSK